MRAITACGALALAVALVTGTARAEKKDVKVTTILDDLTNPSGVAIQPGTGQVFVSDSGALRVLRVALNRGDKKSITAAAIVGFPKDVYGKGPKYDIGPLGLAFLKPNVLVVGGGGQEDGKELLRIYDVPKGPGIDAKEMKHALGPIEPSDLTAKGEGNFYGLAVTPKAIYVTCNGDDTKGWVSRVEIKDGEPGELKPFIATKEATGVDAPVGITVSPDGNLVVGQMGEMNIPQDSLLTVYDPDSGKLISSADTGLHDIADLAFSPKTGKLYAVDFAWVNTKDGGLFRLDVSEKNGKMSVKAVKVAALDRPAALAFDKSGDCYVVTFGGGKGDHGALVKVSGL